MVVTCWFSVCLAKTESCTAGRCDEIALREPGGEVLPVYSNTKVHPGRPQLHFPFAVKVLGLRSCKCRLSPICRQKSSVMEFMTFTTPDGH